LGFDVVFVWVFGVFSFGAGHFGDVDAVVVAVIRSR
jgi:hypothetical protein